MNKIRYCRRCGNPLTEKSRFCDNCGAPSAASAEAGQSGRGQRPENTERDMRLSGQNPNNRQVQKPSGQNLNNRQIQRPSGQNPNSRQVQKPSGQNPNNRQVQRPSGQNPNSRQIQRPSGQNPNNRQVQRLPGQNLNDRQVQRPSGQNLNNSPVRRTSGQNPNFPQGYRPVPTYEEEQRRERYRQEQMERSWQQTWDRAGEEEETGFTPLQYVLIALMVILLIALIAFSAFWIFGRSNNKSDSDRNAAQTNSVSQQQVQLPEEEAIQILDGGSQQVQTEAPIVIQTEKPTEKQTEKQTEAQQDMVISYPEFSLTLPGSWKGKYGITQNGDSYTYYHQGSKAQGYGGEFFTITCYKDTSYKSQGGQLLGMGNGTAYVFTVPSGTVYPQENQAVAEEYKRMNLDFGGISSRFRMLVSGEGPKETEPQQIIEIQQSPNQQVQVEETQQSSQNTSSAGGGYISESSSRPLTDADVSGMSYNDMQMAINEIYARHGRRFSSEAIQSYFDGQSWYSGTVAPEEFSESVFSATEAQNIQFLLNKMGVQ